MFFSYMTATFSLCFHLTSNYDPSSPGLCIRNRSLQKNPPVCWRCCDWWFNDRGSVQDAMRRTYHIREEGGGMFIEADDSLPQLVSLQTIGEGPQLPLHLLPWIHIGEQLPEGQPAGHTGGNREENLDVFFNSRLPKHPLKRRSVLAGPTDTPHWLTYWCYDSPLPHLC